MPWRRKKRSEATSESYQRNSARNNHKLKHNLFFICLSLKSLNAPNIVWWSNSCTSKIYRLLSCLYHIIEFSFTVSSSTHACKESFLTHSWKSLFIINLLEQMLSQTFWSNSSSLSTCITWSTMMTLINEVLLDLSSEIWEYWRSIDGLILKSVLNSCLKK